VKDFAETNTHSNSDSLTGELCSLPSKVVRTTATFNAKGNKLTATSKLIAVGANISDKKGIDNKLDS
jgi:hypothetical protein